MHADACRKIEQCLRSKPERRGLPSPGIQSVCESLPPVRLLFCTSEFHPSHGGVQTVVRLLAGALTELGHDLGVVTWAVAKQPDRFPFRVVRRPSPKMLWQEYRRAELVVLHGAAMSLAWPLLLLKRPTVTVHYMPELPSNQRNWVKELVRRLVLRDCRVHLAPSDAFGATLPCRARGFRHPYDDQAFRIISGTPRDKDLIFAGRMVDIKGVHDLVDALALLSRRGRQYTASFVGDGPERERLIQKVRSEGLAEYVEFHGAVSNEQLAELFNRHRLVVVPSRYHEPFGLVALEGIACGCVAVGTLGGGLPSAIGSCGTLVPNGDAPALADAIEKLIETPGELERIRAGIPDFVSQFKPQLAAECYFKQISQALDRTSS